MLPTLQDLGAADAQQELGRTARLVGLQFHEETARDMDLPTDVERGDRQCARLRALADDDPAAQASTSSREDRRRMVIVTQRMAGAARELVLADPLGVRRLQRAVARRRLAHDRFPEGPQTIRSARR